MISTIILAVIGIALFLWFLKLGYRGKKLLYASAVLLFTIGCFIFLIHREMIFSFIDSTFGVWGGIGVLLGFCLIVWIIMKILF